MSRTRRSLAALTLIALIVAGCSNAPAATQNAPTSTGGGNTTTASYEQAVQFAQCIRNNGVEEFPDPDAKGQFRYGIEKGSSLDPSTAAWRKAIGACKDLEPPGALGEGGRSPAEQEAALKFAQCMRDNGVKDFPDPTKDGPLIDTSKIPSAAGRGARSIPGFQDAAQKCLKVYDGEVGGQ